MHLLAYNFVNLDPNGDTASSTITTGLKIFGDLAPIWQILLSVGVVGLIITILIVAIHPGK
jgi:hypothetical protein